MSVASESTGIDFIEGNLCFPVSALSKRCPFITDCTKEDSKSAPEGSVIVRTGSFIVFASSLLKRKIIFFWKKIWLFLNPLKSTLQKTNLPKILLCGFVLVVAAALESAYFEKLLNAGRGLFSFERKQKWFGRTRYRDSCVRRQASSFCNHVFVWKYSDAHLSRKNMTWQKCFFKKILKIDFLAFFGSGFLHRLPRLDMVVSQIRYLG